jgi:regulator of protease activity HflC (stomatin/prohibitin superfamily)
MPKDMTELCDQTSADYRKITIVPTARAVISKIISSYSAARLYSSSRESLQDKIAMQLGKELNKYDIGLEEVTVRHINFTGTFAGEIKKKQLALQKLEHIKKEADQFNSTPLDYQTANQPIGAEYTRNHWLLGRINNMWNAGARGSSPCCSK